MIRSAMINGIHSKLDPNEHQVTLTIRCQEEDSVAVIKILHETLAKLNAYDPGLNIDSMLLLKDTKNLHPMVVPSKEGEKPN